LKDQKPEEVSKQGEKKGGSAYGEVGEKDLPIDKDMGTAEQIEGT